MSVSKSELLLMLDDVESIIANAPDDSVFDIVEIHENCTVEVLRNTKTGEVSIGWYKSPINNYRSESGIVN
jgi:hypothetical protein